MNDLELKDKLAGNGFRAGIRLLSQKKKISIDAAMLLVATHLDRHVLQINQYTITGLPKHLVEPALTMFRQHGVAVFNHQLRPTNDVVRIHLI